MSFNCSPELLTSWFQKIFSFFSPNFVTSSWEQMTPKFDVANFNTRGIIGRDYMDGGTKHCYTFENYIICGHFGFKKDLFKSLSAL